MYVGGEGDGNGQFFEPRGIAQDASGFFYIADTRNHRVQAFKEDGSFEGKIGAEGDKPGEYKELNDISVDLNTGDLYVADTWNHRIVRMDNKGNILGTFTGNLFGPRGIVYHPQVDLIFVSDTGGHMIRVLNQQGQIVASLGVSGGGFDEMSFREPVGIDVIHTTGDIVVVDSLNKRLKIYSIAGELKKIIPIQSSWNGEGGFEGHVTTSADGIIYMTDPIERSIHAYTQDGTLLGKANNDVEGNPFFKPVGIHMSLDGSLIVADTGANRIAKVKAFATLPSSIPTETPTAMPEPTPTSIPEPEDEEAPLVTPTIVDEPEEETVPEIKRFDRWFEPFSNPPIEQNDEASTEESSDEDLPNDEERPVGMKRLERWFMPFSNPQNE
jgi:DNA-binding beta-propeller fold protein YncE